jgi:F-type H+-transporting ATPase subunit a
MAEHISWFTILLNKWLGGAALALLTALRISPKNPALPIPNFVAMDVVVFCIGVLFFLWLKPRISVARPGATQQVMEYILTNPMRVGIQDLLDDSIEHDPRHYVTMVGSIAMFILIANLISIVPSFDSPTGHPSVPLACAILTFISFNWWGLRHHGPIGYAKTFAGPVWQLSWLLFPVEIISSVARLLSLTVRLWANMFASELIYVVFLGLLMTPVQHFSVTQPALSYALAIFPILIPPLFILLHAFVAVVQAFIFTVLPAVYIGMATSHDH